MAEKQLANGDSASEKSVLMSSCSSSNETLPPRPTELQPYSLGRMPSPSSQSSVVVPVRLDVLLFLLNSAARGAQYTLSPMSVQGGQGSLSACHHGPAAQPVPNCCGCPSTAHNVCQPCGTHQHGGGHSSHVGAVESRGSGHSRDVGSHRNERGSWPAASSTGGWRMSQPLAGWQEKPRGGGRGRDNGDRWQNSGRSWGDRRHSAGDSAWRSGSQDWRREGSAFVSNFSNNKRAQEGCLRPPWDAPDAKRPTDNSRVDWMKGQERKESTCFRDKSADDGPRQPAVQEDEEDWETDYARPQTSSSAPVTVSCPARSGISPNLPEEEEGAPCDGPSKRKPLTSRLPESTSKTQAVAAASAKPAVASETVRSKNSSLLGFLNLYSDLPRKSGSEDSSDLVIDMDAESTKPDEEERSPKDEAGRE